MKEKDILENGRKDKEERMNHEFSRTELLIGRESLQKLKHAKVLVFGVGGVGSHCIEALARGGVGSLVLVDNDVVSVSNINRQSIAYHSTIGRYKTEVMKEKIKDICPDIQVETKNVFVLPENLSQVIDVQMLEDIDYIIDAIDTVSAKLCIAEFALKNQIPILSCMGTGNKINPHLFEIADISKTEMCPLCKVMRRELKARGIYHLPVLYSKEKPMEPKGECREEHVVGKRATPGSISFAPPVAGLFIAAHVIKEIIKA